MQALRTAYGNRCQYCDHAHGWSIDHAVPQSVAQDKRFDWGNWRLSCLDCNNKKAAKRVVDPLTGDPRRHVVFSLATGEPIAIGKPKSVIGRNTTALLNNQTLNEARRAARDRMVLALRSLGQQAPHARTDALALTEYSSPHRAMLRELILEENEALNPYRDIVAAALSQMPQLLTWALRPNSA